MKTFSIILLAVLLYLSHASATFKAFKQPPSFIINGQNAKLGDLPHQLALSGSNMMNTYCSAVLISATQALTAAHCVHQELASDVKVFAGVVDKFEKSGQVADVKNIVVYPKYDVSKRPPENDLAILTFEHPLNLNKNVQPIAWNQDENVTFTGEKCVISGWGKTKFMIAYDLKKVTIDIISNTECKKLKDIHASNICALTPKYGACTGDSGGPITCQHNGKPILAGVTSFVFRKKYAKTCNTNAPSIYSRLSSFKKFINDNIDN